MVDRDSTLLSVDGALILTAPFTRTLRRLLSDRQLSGIRTAVRGRRKRRRLIVSMELAGRHSRSALRRRPIHLIEASSLVVFAAMVSADVASRPRHRSSDDRAR